ncbi:MAG: SIS domain-containing protein [Candidatus Latescibacteria bacterium]|nr:SIS domain-containing protein [Candidatus Latescibacterota bacterium]
MEMIADYLTWASESCLTVDPGQVQRLIDLLFEARANGRRVFIIGNGGSAATASHFCEDLGKCTLTSLDDPLRFKVISLTDNLPYVTAWANDNGYETVFEQQLRNLAEPGDLVIGISASGNSPNVLRAIAYANEHGLTTIGLTGFDGGRLREMAHHPVHVPIHDYGMAESVHMIIFHLIINRATEIIRAPHAERASGASHP